MAAYEGNNTTKFKYFKCAECNFTLIFLSRHKNVAEKILMLVNYRKKKLKFVEATF